MRRYQFNCHVVLLFLAIWDTLNFTAADLESDFCEFSALVPRRRIGYIAARYYIFDVQFQQALAFVRGNAFQDTWQQIRATPEFGEIIEYAIKHGSGYDVTSIIDKLPNRLRAFKISRIVPVSMLIERNLTTFLREVLQSLPRAKISDLLVRKVSENGDFARLYKALSASEFQHLVSRARNSPNLQSPLHKMQENFVNVDEVLLLIFELISWGPPVMS